MVVKDVAETEDRPLRAGEPCSTPPPSSTGQLGTSGYTSEMIEGDVSYSQTDYLSQKSVMSVNASSEVGIMHYTNGGGVDPSSTSVVKVTAYPDGPGADRGPADHRPAHYYQYGNDATPTVQKLQQQQQQQQQHQHTDSMPQPAAPIQIEPIPLSSSASDAHKLDLKDTLHPGYGALQPQPHHLNQQQQKEHQQQQQQQQGYNDFSGRQAGGPSPQSAYLFPPHHLEEGGLNNKEFDYRKDHGPTLKIPRYNAGMYSHDKNYFLHDKEGGVGPTKDSSGGEGTPTYRLPTPEGRNGEGGEQQYEGYDSSTPNNAPSRAAGSQPPHRMYGFDKPAVGREEGMTSQPRDDDVTQSERPTSGQGQTELTNEQQQQQQQEEVVGVKNGSSPLRRGDDHPATHSDSGIVHDGGSNTSSNSATSGDQDDSATGLKPHSPPPATGTSNGVFRYNPSTPAGAVDRKETALSSPFLTQSGAAPIDDGVDNDKMAAMDGARRDSFPTGPPAFPSPLSTSGDETPPERRPSLHVPHLSRSMSSPHSMTSSHSMTSPMGLPPGMAPTSPFLSPGSGGMGLSPSPRNPLTPGSTRSGSPDSLPPMMDKNKDVYFCHLCSYVGTSQFHFKQHMDTHFEHRCPHCDYTSRTEGRLKRHIKDFHSDVPPDNYSGNRTIRNPAPKPKVYKCKQCDYQTMAKVEFWEHSRGHIKEDKVLQCPKCPFVTEYKHHLEYHLRNHFGSKPFKCPKCNYACVNKSMLNSHMKSHTNVYQYRCADCTYATKYCHSLKLHLKKYNHKPATVLNADGSLPTDGSGDFELVSKRGPPRGPRGPRKGDRPDHMPQQPPMGMGPVMMPGMGMNNIPPPPGLMPGYWPMMPPMPNGGLHPPPPLIPVSGASFNPSLPMSMQAHDHQMMLHHQQQQQHHQNQQQHDERRDNESHPDNRSNSGGPTHSHIKCVICDYTTDSRPSLNEHMLKVHAKENQDLLNMFGVQADALGDDHGFAAAAAAAAAAAVVGRPHSSSDTSKPEMSEMAATPIKQEGVPRPQGSPPPANQAWIMNTSQPGARKSTPGNNIPGPGGAFPSPMFRSTPHGALPSPLNPQTQMEMMQQHMLKERYNAVIAAEIASNIEAEAKQNGECPLDLTKRKEQMHLANQMFFNPSFMFSQMHKRKFDEISMAAMAAASATQPAGEDGQSPPPDNATPRKRSRKGKAYKLDTICQKLQERYGDSPTHGDGYNDDDTSDSINSGANDQAAAGSHGEGAESEQIDYRAIHSSLSELNSQMSMDSYRSHPSDFDKERPEDSDNGPKDGPVGMSYSETVNRRKLFMVRHLEQQQGAARGGDGDHSEVNGQGLRSEPKAHAEVNDDREGGSEDRSAAASPAGLSRPNSSSAAPPYECNHCAIAFRDCVMYTVHMGYHGYQDPFKCNMCGHVAQNRVEFFLHIARAAHE